MRRSPLVAAAMVLAVVVAGCSDDGEVPELRTFRPDDPDAAFTISEPSRLGCPMSLGSEREDSVGPLAQMSMLDPITGEVRWETDTPWGGSGEWAAVADSLVVPVSDPGFYGLIAMDASTGRPRWERLVDDGLGGPHDVFAADDTVVTVDGLRVIGVDPLDGSVRWQRESSHDDRWRQLLATTDDGVVVVHQDGSTDYLAADDGTVRWSVGPPGGEGAIAPLIVDGTVVTGTRTGSLQGISVGTGEVLWARTPGPDRSWLPPELAGGFPASGFDGFSYSGTDERAPSSGAGLILIADAPDPGLEESSGTGTQRPEIVVLDPVTGDEMRRALESGPVLDDIVVMTTPAVRAMDTATGDLRWETDFAADAVARPDNGLVLAVTRTEEESTLVALDPDTGAIRWEASLPGSIGGRDIGEMIDGQLIVTLIAADDSQEGLVLALDPGTGDERWRTARRDPVWVPASGTEEGIAILSSEQPVDCF